jgi:integrase
VPQSELRLPHLLFREMRALSPDQARAFLAKAADDEWFALWRLLLTTGIRPGEPCGLKWATGNELIFANPQGGPIDIRALVRPHFNRILSRAGPPIFAGMTFATLQLQSCWRAAFT